MRNPSGGAARGGVRGILFGGMGAVAMVSMAACNLLVADGELASCEDAEGVVLPAAPPPSSGWEGPHFLVESEGDFLEPGSCPTATAPLGEIIGSGVDEAAMSHDCGCSLASDACRVEVIVRSSNCLVPGTTTLIAAEGCTAVQGNAGQFVQRDFPVVSGACEATVEPAPVRWRAQARRCAPTLLDVGENCASTRPAGVQLCVSHPGDVACPAESPYQQRLVFDQKLDDRRMCACGVAEGECDVSLAFYGGAAQCALGPAGLGVLQLQTSECTTIPTSFTHARLGSTLSTPSCATEGGGLVGAVESSQPVTVCCLADA